MTTKVQLHLTYTDGTTRVVATERDDAAGRKAIDIAAFEAILVPEVREAHTSTSDRIPMNDRRSYR